MKRRSPIILLTLLLFVGQTEARSAEEKEDAVDFVTQIKPLLERSCLKCHGPDQDQGSLRLHTREATFEGGDSGPAIEPKNLEESWLYDRVILPADDPLHMPADGEPFTEEETNLIRDWINQGASWPDEIVLQLPGMEGQEELPEIAVEPLTDEELETMDNVRGRGGHVMQLAQNDNRLEVAFHLADGNINDEYLVPLKDLKRIVHLNLRGTEVTDNGLENLKDLTALTRLHLEQTGITDQGLEHLKGLENLEYLNLYGTQVSDEGLTHLEGLQNLRKLFLWETQVTEAGIEKLKQALPGVEIVHAIELPDPPEEDEEDDEENEEDE